MSGEVSKKQDIRSFYEEAMARLLYNPDTGEFSWKKKGYGHRRRVGYIKHGYHLIGIKVNNKYRQLPAHRIAFFMHYGYLPRVVDHIDRNKANNTIGNLRGCSHKENCRNSNIPDNNTSGYKGVHWCNTHQKWIAQIGINYKRIKLGSFDCKHKAAKAYNDAAVEYHKEFSTLNELKNI